MQLLCQKRSACRGVVKLVIVSVNGRDYRACELHVRLDPFVLHAGFDPGISRHMVVSRVLGQLIFYPVGIAALGSGLVHHVMHDVLVVVGIDGHRQVEVTAVYDHCEDDEKDDKFRPGATPFILNIAEIETIHKSLN